MKIISNNIFVVFEVTVDFLTKLYFLPRITVLSFLETQLIMPFVSNVIKVGPELCMIRDF